MNWKKERFKIFEIGLRFNRGQIMTCHSKLKKKKIWYLNWCLFINFSFLTNKMCVAQWFAYHWSVTYKQWLHHTLTIISTNYHFYDLCFFYRKFTLIQKVKITSEPNPGTIFYTSKIYRALKLIKFLSQLWHESSLYIYIYMDWV